MIYRLKQAIMCHTLDKRNRQKPFDYPAAESYSLEGEQDPMLNNSYYFSAHDGTLSVFARLGRRVNADETWFAVFLGGEMYSLQQECFPAGASPLRVERVDGKWLVSFKGLLNGHVEADFSAAFQPQYPPVDFTSHMPPRRMATGIANEKWSWAFFAGLQTVSGQCHYEQEGILEGKLNLGGRSLELRLPCVRDHSFGRRDWNYMNNHLWLMAVCGECQFNYSLVSYPAITALEVGHFREGSAMHYMLEADLDFHKVAAGTIPGELSFRVRLDNGRQLPVTASVLSGVTYHFQDGRYILHENVARFKLGDTECRGILEIGFNSDAGRYFNQRDLNTIKR